MLSQKRIRELDNLLEELDLTISDYERLDRALTHSSYTFENKLSSLENNERLEFLGDAVLKLIASDYLLDRFPEYSEGELTKIRAILISDSTLVKLANEINLGKYLKLGYHEDKNGGRSRPSTLACAFEALLGALYLDGKEHELRLMLINLLDEEITRIDESDSKFNFKAILQEYTQAKGLGLPEYKIIKEEGPAHSKTFEIEVLIQGEPYGTGKGKSKKEAQQIAAQNAVEKIQILQGKKGNSDE